MPDALQMTAVGLAVAVVVGVYVSYGRRQRRRIRNDAEIQALAIRDISTVSWGLFGLWHVTVRQVGGPDQLMVCVARPFRRLHWSERVEMPRPSGRKRS